MAVIRKYDFIVGAETSTLPDAGTPSASNDLITLGYAQTNFITVPAVTGTYAAPQAIVAGTGIAFTGTAYFNIWFVEGSGGPVDITANPQIAVTTTVGAMLTVVGCSDTNTVKLEHGTGLTMNGECILGAGSVIQFIWAGATLGWTEVSRSGL